MADLLVVVLLVVRGVWWPINALLNAVLCVLSPFWTLACFVLLPFTHLVHVIAGILSLPFTVAWRERIETLYIYLGTAALIGCLTGAILFSLSKLLSSTLSIEASNVPPKRSLGRTTAEFREERRIKKEEDQQRSQPVQPVVGRVLGRPARGLLSQAIIEEDDSDF